MELFAKWLPYILAGVSVGGQYALIAIGYTMVYGILQTDQLRPRRHVHDGRSGYDLSGICTADLAERDRCDYLYSGFWAAPSKKWLIVRCAPRRECRS